MFTRGISFVLGANLFVDNRIRERRHARMGSNVCCMSSRDGKGNEAKNGEGLVTTTTNKKETYCGYAALLGPSNSGKSTLLNLLVGYKVAIVTPKVQTTRCRIAGIASYNDDTQVIYLDTPGVFSATNRLSRAMVKSAWRSSRDGDVIAIVLDGIKLKKSFASWRRKNKEHEGDSNSDSEADTDFDDGKIPIDESVSADICQVLEGVMQGRERGRFQNVCLCINKMDIVGSVSKIQSELTELLSFYKLDDQPMFYLSARTGDNMEPFKQWVVKNMPKGPWLYDDDDMTDMPSRQLAAEVSREKAFMLLSQELPYELAVETKDFKHLDDGSIRITQEILVGRDSQKRIVTGRGGSVVKQIGMKARADLGDIFGTTVHLMITVKIRKDWKEDKWQFQQWGLDYNA